MNPTPTWAEKKLQEFDRKFRGMPYDEGMWPIKDFLHASLNDLIQQLEGLKEVCLLPHSFEEQRNALPYCEHVRQHNKAIDAAIALLRTGKE